MGKNILSLIMFYSFPTLSYSLCLFIIAAIAGYIFWKRMKRSKLFMIAIICVCVGIVLCLVQRYLSFIWRSDLRRLLYASSRHVTIPSRQLINASMIIGAVFASCVGCALFMAVILKNSAIDFKKKTIVESTLVCVFGVLGMVILFSLFFSDHRSKIFWFFYQIRRDGTGKKRSTDFTKDIIFFLCDSIQIEGDNRISKNASDFFIDQWNNTFSDKLTPSLYNKRFHEMCPRGTEGVGKMTPKMWHQK